MERPTFQKVKQSVQSHAREAIGGVALLTLAAVACKGSQGQEVKTTPTLPANSPVATEKIAPTPSPELPPTPEQTRFVPKKLSEAQFKPATFEEVVVAIDLAYQAHPDAAVIDYKGTGPIPRERLSRNLSVCHEGDPTSPGYPRTLEVNRVTTCANLVERLDFLYEMTGYEEFFQGEKATANYLLTELPHRKADFDELLTSFINDTSPSLEK